MLTEISIIVPVYNAEKYLRKCISSILAQKSVSIELILVNDGSNDASGTICDEYAVNDERVKVFHVKNGGPARARNIGMNHATGKYIGFVDADDYIEPDMYSLLLQKAEANNYEITTCGFDLILNGQTIGITHPELGNSELLGSVNIRGNAISKYYTANAGTWPSLWNKLYLREFIEKEHTRIDESLIRAEDYWFNFDLICRAERIGSVDMIAYHYVQDNQNSTMHSIRENQYVEWKASRQKLLQRNQVLQIQFDPYSFTEGFLYNVSVHLRDLVSVGKWEKAKFVLLDPYYTEMITYDRNLPKHIKVLHSFVKHHKYIAAHLWLWIWGKHK